jgi:hypothetical protein
MEVSDGYGSAGAPPAPPEREGSAARPGGGQDRHGREDGTEVPPARQAAQRGATHGTRLPHAARPLRRGLAAARGVASGQPRAGGQDLVRRFATPLPRPLRRRPTADPAAAGEAVARPGGAGQGGVLRPGSLPRKALRQRLHALRRPARDHRRGAFGSPDLPLRADLLELGDGDDLLRGELREPGRGPAERSVGTGRRAATAPHRPADGGDPAGHGGLGVVHRTLPGVAAALRPRGPGDPGGPCPRERGRGAEPPPVQAGVGPGPLAAWRPGFCEPGGVRGVPASSVRATQRRPAGTVSRGAAAVASAAATPSRIVPAAPGAGGHGQHDPRPGQHLLGGEPPDRGAGGGEAVRGAGGGVVRPAAGGVATASAWPRQAPHRVPPRDRLAGAQAGGVRRLSLPAGPVPVEPLPAGLRPVAPASSGAGGEGVPGDPAPGGAAFGERRRGGPDGPLGGGPAAERGGGGCGAEPE